MASYHSYHVRVMRPNGSRLDGATIFKLRAAVDYLNQLTGIEWPYQVLHRVLKSGCWAEAFKDKDGDQLIAVVEDIGNGLYGFGQLWPAASAKPAVPAGLVEMDKPMLIWTEDDEALFKSGGKPTYFIKPSPIIQW